jgi:serine phosphatase RsbU (regulator of sigma subunit)
VTPTVEPEPARVSPAKAERSSVTQTSTTPAEPGRLTASGGATPAVLQVLLVEDDSADAFLVRGLLEEVSAPVELTVTTTIAEAERAIGATKVDCVLLDLGLPDAQGLEGLRRLLQLDSSAAICVLTGLGDEHLGAEALAEGAQDYLIKGQVDGTLLARSIRYAVERQRADENARRLHQVELEQKESARLERGLLPHPLLRSTDLKVHTFYQAGRGTQLGGDFYDVVQTGPTRLSMMVGDVCGHGVDAAALGVELRVAWRALILAQVDDDAVLPALEQVLISERKGEEVFATLAMVTVALDTGETAVRLAGHPPPLLLTGGAAVTVPGHHGPVLGVFEDAKWRASRTRIAGPDWALLLYTDGLIEGRAGETDARLDVTGLHTLIERADAAAVSRAQLPGWLVDQAERANGGPLADDVAMLLLTPARMGV